jgi:hypothetical protein
MHFSMAKKPEVVRLLNENHYIGAQCADPTHVFVWREDGGLFGDSGRPVVAGVFAPSAARAWGAAAIELVRLVRTETVDAPLTMFLAECFRFLRQEGRFRLVVAYADPDAGHHGGIYQAGNWLYVGLSSAKTLYVHEATGRRSSQRSFDQSHYSIDDGWQKRKTGRKYTYLYPLTRRERRRWIGRAISPPKPNPRGIVSKPPVAETLLHLEP